MDEQSKLRPKIALSKLMPTVKEKEQKKENMTAIEEIEKIIENEVIGVSSEKKIVELIPKMKQHIEKLPPDVQDDMTSLIQMAMVHSFKMGFESAIEAVKQRQK
jgi:hypothetical protein